MSRIGEAGGQEHTNNSNNIKQHIYQEQRRNQKNTGNNNYRYWNQQPLVNTPIPTYSPTLPWPTYAPTASVAFGDLPTKKQKVTQNQKEKKKQWKQQQKEEEEEQRIGETKTTSSPSTSPSPSVDTLSSILQVSATEQPTVDILATPASTTGTPTSVPTASPSVPMSSSSRYYGGRVPSESVTRPLSHGGLGTEVVPTPHPTEQVNTEAEVPVTSPSSRGGSYGSGRGSSPTRGSYGGGRGSSPSAADGEKTQEVPAAPTLTSVQPSLDSLTTAVVNSTTTNALEVIETRSGGDEATVPDNPVPVVEPVSSPGRQPSKPSRYSGRQPSRPSRNSPSSSGASDQTTVDQPVPVTSEPTPTPTKATYSPTPEPTPAPMKMTNDDDESTSSSLVRESAPSARQPSRPSRGRQPSKPSRTVPSNEEPAVQIESSTKEEGDETSKLDLSFMVEPPTPAQAEANNPSSTSKLNLSFTAIRTDDIPTYEPTYFLYPTESPVGAVADSTEDVTSNKKDKKKDKKKKQEDAMIAANSVPRPTNWPTYYPTSSSRFRPSDGLADGRHSFKDPVNNASPTLEDSTSWTWSPTVGNGTTVDQQQQPDEPLSSIYEKRICPGYPFGIDPMAPKREEQVFFAYGIQTATITHGTLSTTTDKDNDESMKSAVRHSDSVTMEDNVEQIQLWLLEDVARHLLSCPDTNDQGENTGGGRLLKTITEGVEQSVSRIYYMEDDSIATMSDCTPTIADATGCAIIQSSIYITAATGHEDEARANALSVIHHRLERGSYEQGTILHTSYLGPDLDALSLIGRHNNKGSSATMNEASGSSSSSSTMLFYVAIGVVSVALLALFVFAMMVRRAGNQRRKDKEQVSLYS